MERHKESASREETIADLRSRLLGLKTGYWMNDPEVIILQKALSLERKVLGSPEKQRPAVNEGYFTTGYAGRRSLEWEYDDREGKWVGRLYNIASGILKKEAKGSSAEEMLRQIL